MSENINWDEMGGKFIKLENGIPMRLKLTNWRQQTQFKDDNGNVRFGLSFDVLQHDNIDCSEDPRNWTITAIKACAKFKPIIEKAEAAGKKVIEISVLRAGEGKQTVYEISKIDN